VVKSPTSANVRMEYAVSMGGVEQVSVLVWKKEKKRTDSAACGGEQHHPH